MLTLALTAVGVWCWPDRRASCRVTYRAPLRVATVATSCVRRCGGWRGLVLLLSVPSGAFLAGPGGAVAALALAWTGRACQRSWGKQQRQSRGWEELADGLRLFIAQLRTGAHPTAAAEGAATESDPAVAVLFREIATTTQLGGDVPATLLRTRNESGVGMTRGELAAVRGPERAVTHEWLRRPRESMARCWGLAARHGAGLAELLDSVRRDLEAKAAFHRRVQADLAGPRATAVVLSALPLLGLALGEAAGARPSSILRASMWGQVLLVVGTGLLCIGALWTVRLTGGGQS